MSRPPYQRIVCAGSGLTTIREGIVELGVGRVAVSANFFLGITY